jgi:hypothetical protein
MTADEIRQIVRDALHEELGPLRVQIDDLITAERETCAAARAARDVAVKIADEFFELAARLDRLELAHRARTEGVGCGVSAGGL